MSLKIFKPTTPGRRFSTGLDFSVITKRKPEKGLVSILPKKSGRNSTGKVTTRHQGAREKRMYREIDWKRNKDNIMATVVAVEYDPNRTANLALIMYEDGERRYILSPDGLGVGKKVVSGESAPLNVGNTLPLSAIPVGTAIHNLEVVPGKGGQMVRSAGSAAVIMGFEDLYALVKLPSGEIRRFRPGCRATIGQLSNTEWKNINLGKAGRKRHMGIRPTVRGTAQHPGSHPHGGGEGRSGEGMHPKTPWGKPARGKRTRKRIKHSRYLIVQRRK